MTLFLLTECWIHKFQCSLLVSSFLSASSLPPVTLNSWTGWPRAKLLGSPHVAFLLCMPAASELGSGPLPPRAPNTCFLSAAEIEGEKGGASNEFLLRLELQLVSSVNPPGTLSCSSKQTSRCWRCFWTRGLSHKCHRLLHPIKWPFDMSKPSTMSPPSVRQSHRDGLRDPFLLLAVSPGGDAHSEGASWG